MLVRTNRFSFPTNFVVMEIEECKEVPIILGRPFLKALRMIINVDKGKVKIQIQN